MTEVDALLREASADGGLTLELRRAKDGYVEAGLTLDGQAQTGTAVLFTNGAEGFHLRLDDDYYLREFDHEPPGQQDLIRTLVGVAGAHLRGDSTPALEPRRLRQDRRALDVKWRGETYRARN